MNQLIANIKDFALFQDRLRNQGVLGVSRHLREDIYRVQMDTDEFFNMVDTFEADIAIAPFKDKQYPYEFSFRTEGLEFFCIVSKQEAYERKVLHD